MTKQELYEKLKKFGVMPVIAIESVEDALPLSDALIAGGLPCAEITFRTEAAADVMNLLNKERPDLILGAGTVLNLENLHKAKDAGALFGVAPGLNPKIVEEAHKIGLPFVPGVVTPSEVGQAIDLGADLLKFFPAEASGGLDMIKALFAPYGHTGIKFMPTGGVKTGNVADYLSYPGVLVAGGTWIANKDVIAAKKWDEITANCKEAVELVKKLGR